MKKYYIKHKFPRIINRSYLQAYNEGYQKGIKDGVPKGLWFQIKPNKFYCTHCGTIFQFDKDFDMNFLYCPQCGAENISKGDK